MSDNFYISLPHGLSLEAQRRIEKAVRANKAAVNRLLKHELRGWDRDITKLRNAVSQTRTHLSHVWDAIRSELADRSD